MINLPNELQEEYKNWASFLLYELKNKHLQVGLKDAPEPMHYDHKIRIVLNSNPEWYSNLYHNHPCKFARRLLLESLERFRELGVTNQCKYDIIVYNLIKTFLLEGYEEIPPNIHAENYYNDKVPF